MGITIHYYTRNESARRHAKRVLDGLTQRATPTEQANERAEAEKNIKLIVPKIARNHTAARKKFFAAVDHVDRRARDLGWKYLGVDLYPEDATKYRDENGRQLTWQDFGGNVIQFYWLPDPGSEAVQLGFNFDTNAFVGGFTKTQYIKSDRLKKHIDVCEVLTEVNTILGGILDIYDEAHYLPDRNVDAAGKNFGESDAMISSLGRALRAQFAGTDVQIVTGDELAQSETNHHGDEDAR
jgi:DNA-binding transcriptional regulator PaaX